jgi:predicted acyl esterase
VAVLMLMLMCLTQDDALEILEWIERQPWCSGGVGMYGKSWGGGAQSP